MLCMEENINMRQEVIDTATFEEMFELYYPALVKYAYTIVLHESDAEDLVQSVFTSFWAGKGNIKIHTSAKALLYRAVYHRSLNHLKKKKATTGRTISEWPLDLGAEDTDHLELHDLDSRIGDAIKKLPDQCKKVFLLSRINELKYKEIASKMGISIKTVENQMGKALQVLRRELKDYLHLLFILINSLF
ncbi:MAG: RNA polymerase sigma-70 factor [Saprospiraceae bacterium]|nr:RNA polymerase sigma-70 factor [Saprospiraceae bacterium]